MATPEELWNDLMAITSDPQLPRAELTGAQIAGEDDILADTCNRLGEVVSERYGLLAGHVGSEAARRLAPTLLRGLRRMSRRRKRSG